VRRQPKKAVICQINFDRRQQQSTLFFQDRRWAMPIQPLKAVKPWL
jgi:hypothetical protein